jgi:ubiquinone/menaquinone biosynthesis C-methylase UbiE
MSQGHAKIVEDAFTRQAAAFEDTRRNRVFTTDAEWLFDRVELTGSELVLDVAAGTGHAARLLAPRSLAVIAVDATPAMLAEGRERLEHDGVRNVVLLRGDANELHFADATFDVAVVRFAIHHFEDPTVPIAEMVRCLRDGGRVVVADLVASDLPEVAERQNHLERLRDPSHVTALSAAGLAALLTDAGLADVDVEVRSVERPLEPWLDQTGSPPEVVKEVEAALRAELEGGPATGLEPAEHDGALHFVQSFASVMGSKPA